MRALRLLSRIGPSGTGADRAVNGPPDGWRQRDQNDLGAFTAPAQYPVTVPSRRSVMSAPGGLEVP